MTPFANRAHDPATYKMGCHECEQLRVAFSRVVEKNRSLLAEYTDSVMRRDYAETDRIRFALLDVEQKRREARIRLLAHDETHNDSFAVAKA